MSSTRSFLWALVVSVAAGCDSRVAFVADETVRRAAQIDSSSVEAIDAALVELMGTPDEPNLPEGLAALDGLALDLNRLAQSAGPVISHTPGVTQGLYRRHCARCHGVTGDGRGPASYCQSPYPRDFRLGVFKWKSTWRDARPTRVDLAATLERGVAGTAMPSFRLLAEEERAALVDYVVYLSLRGELERELVGLVADEYDAAPAVEDLVDAGRDALDRLAKEWVEADKRVVSTPTTTSDERSLALGRDLYHSERAGCVKCHGAAGQGGASPQRDYDDWTRPRVELAAKGVAIVDLPAREAPAPALAGRAPHGGATRDELYRRLHQGVAGTPMPAVGPRRPGEAAALSDEEVAAIADYVRSLMQEPQRREERDGRQEAIRTTDHTDYSDESGVDLRSMSPLDPLDPWAAFLLRERAPRTASASQREGG